MKRKWIMAAGLCVFITIASIGCGAKGEEPQIVTVEEINPPEIEQTKENEIFPDNESVENKTEELEGNVKSIGDSGVVIIKAIIEERGDESQVMVGSAPGYESEEDLVDVSFKELTEYELRVVKNGGVNPDEDVSVREAAFSDIKENASISLEGFYEGDVFVAEKVVLYEFV